MPEFVMPSLGADMTEGTLVEWLVQPGTQVHKGDLVAVVDTDKAAIEVECFDEGVVSELLVQPGTRVSVGTPLAVIGSASAAPPAPVEEQHRITSPLVRQLAQENGIIAETTPASGPGGEITRADVERATRATVRPKASPRARRLASQLGVDLGSLAGTEEGDVIRADDVRKAGEPREAPVPRESATTKDRGPAMRQAIARLMARSKKEIPHYYLSTTIDLATAMNWLHDRNRDLPVSQRLVPAAMLLKATALAAREVPELNGFWTDDQFQPAPSVHVGLAVSLRGGGLVTPALRDAADLDLADVMTRLRDLVSRARGGRLRGQELTDATITVTNLGDQGVESVYGVIYPPQVALVGFGKVLDRPWAVDGLIGVRPLLTATLAADHRATDGFTGGRFLDAITRLLQQPEEL